MKKLPIHLFREAWRFLKPTPGELLGGEAKSSRCCCVKGKIRDGKLFPRCERGGGRKRVESAWSCGVWGRQQAKRIEKICHNIAMKFNLISSAFLSALREGAMEFRFSALSPRSHHYWFTTRDSRENIFLVDERKILCTKLFFRCASSSDENKKSFNILNPIRNSGDKEHSVMWIGIERTENREQVSVDFIIVLCLTRSAEGQSLPMREESLSRPTCLRICLIPAVVETGKYHKQ